MLTWLLCDRPHLDFILFRLIQYQVFYWLTYGSEPLEPVSIMFTFDVTVHSWLANEYIIYRAKFNCQEYSIILKLYMANYCQTQRQSYVCFETKFCLHRLTAQDLELVSRVVHSCDVLRLMEGAKGRSRRTKRWNGKGCCHRCLWTRCSFCLQVNSSLLFFTSRYQHLLVSVGWFQFISVLFWRNAGKWRTLRWSGFFHSASTSPATDRSVIWSEEIETVAIWSTTWISSRWKQHHRHASVWCGSPDQCTCTEDRSGQREHRRWWNNRQEDTAETTSAIGWHAVAKSRAPSSLGIWGCRCKYDLFSFKFWRPSHIVKLTFFFFFFLFRLAQLCWCYPARSSLFFGDKFGQIYFLLLPMFYIN